MEWALLIAFLLPYLLANYLAVSFALAFYRSFKKPTDVFATKRPVNNFERDTHSW